MLKCKIIFKNSKPKKKKFADYLWVDENKIIVALVVIITTVNVTQTHGIDMEFYF